MKITAYHGSQTSRLKMRENSKMYFTTDYENAVEFAKRAWDEGLIEGEIPVVYTVELTINNPCEYEDFNDFCDLFLEEDKEDLIEQGYDSVMYQNENGITYYVVFFPNQFRILHMEKLPKSHEYYYTNEGGINPDDVDEYYYEEDEINEVLEIAGIKDFV